MIGEITIEKGVVVLPIHAGIVPPDSIEFLSNLRDMLEQHSIRGFIWDYSGVPFLASQAIGFLFLVMKELGTPECPFVMTGAGTEVSKVMSMVGMTRVCPSFPNREEAFEHFPQPYDETKESASSSEAVEASPNTEETSSASSETEDAEPDSNSNVSEKEKRTLSSLEKSVMTLFKKITKESKKE